MQEPDGITKFVDSTDILKDSRLRFRENAALLLKNIKELPAEDRGDFWRFLAKDCSLVVISTSDFDAAYRIFSVLNNRGLDLAPTDIIKAELLGEIRSAMGEDTSHNYAKKWVDIEKMLGRDNFIDLFSHLRSIYAKQKAKSALLKELKEYLPEYRQQRPIDLIDNVIKPYADVWGFLYSADFEATHSAERINEYIFSLNLIGFKDWIPPALLYCKCFRQQPEKIAEFCALLERLTYFLAITHANVNKRIEVYANLMKEIELPEFDGNANTLSRLNLTNKQKEEFISTLDGNIYRNLPQVRRPLVLRLETLLSDGSKQQTFNHISLERHAFILVHIRKI